MHLILGQLVPAEGPSEPPGRARGQRGPPGPLPSPEPHLDPDLPTPVSLKPFPAPCPSWRLRLLPRLQPRVAVCWAAARHHLALAGLGTWQARPAAPPGAPRLGSSNANPAHPPQSRTQPGWATVPIACLGPLTCVPMPGDVGTLRNARSAGKRLLFPPRALQSVGQHSQAACQLARGCPWEWSLGALGPVGPGRWAGSARAPARGTCGPRRAWQPRAGLGCGMAGGRSPPPSRPARAGAETGPPGQPSPSRPVLGDLRGGGLGGGRGTEAFLPRRSQRGPGAGLPGTRLGLYTSCFPRAGLAELGRSSRAFPGPRREAFPGP